MLRFAGHEWSRSSAWLQHSEHHSVRALPSANRRFAGASGKVGERNTKRGQRKMRNHHKIIKFATENKQRDLAYLDCLLCASLQKVGNCQMIHCRNKSHMSALEK